MALDPMTGQPISNWLQQESNLGNNFRLQRGEALPGDVIRSRWAWRDQNTNTMPSGYTAGGTQPPGMSPVGNQVAPQSWSPSPSNIGSYMDQYNQLLNPQQAGSPVLSAPIPQNSGVPSQPSPSANNPNMTQGKGFTDLPMYNLLFGNAAQQSWNSNPVNSMLQNTRLSVPGFMLGDAYRLQYGNNFKADPADRFKNDPGVQAAIQEGTRQLANAYSAKGLGASGAAAAGLTDFMYKNYNDFTGNQQNLYQNEWAKLNRQQQDRATGYLGQQSLLGNIYSRYQDQLGSLANLGMGISNQTGNLGAQIGGNIGQLIGNWQMGAGGQLGQWGMGTGQNIAELLANAGIFDANIWAALGANMSNNMLQGSLFGAQLANAQNASNAQSLSSMLQGAGAMRGLNPTYMPNMNQGMK